MNKGTYNTIVNPNGTWRVHLNTMTDSQNGTTTDGHTPTDPIPDLSQPVYMIIIYSLAYGLIFLFGLVGNILVIAVVCRTRRLYTLTNFFIVNLAVADMLVTVFCIPINLLTSLFTGWRFGAVLCKLAPYFQGVSVCASVYTLAAIAADRYLAICFTLEHKMTWRIAKVIVTLIWTLALSIMVPWLLYYRQKPNMMKDQLIYVCGQEWPYDKGEEMFVLAVFIVCYVFPLLLIIICYVMIIVRVWTRNAPGIFRYNNVIRKSKVKVIKMLAMIVVWFGLSWLPLYTLFLIIYFNPPATGSQTEDILFNISVPIAQWVAMSNSGVNPLIYCFFSKAIRKRVIAMLSCTKQVVFTRHQSRFSGTRFMSMDLYSNGQISLRVNKKKSEKSFFSCNGNSCESMFYD